MSKHTPGPWSVSNDPNDGWPLVMAGGKIIANVNPESFFAGVADLVELPAESNAAMIAAAPELLAALEEMLTIGQPEGLRDMARAAIAKARGEA